MTKIFFFLLVLLLGHFSFAAGEGQIRFGVQGGNVAVAEKINGTDPGNAVGGGAIFNFGVTEEMMLELTYNTSSHSHYNHTDIGGGVNFYFNSYDPAYFYVAAGANLNTGKTDSTAGDKSASAFGLYGGLGVDFDLGKFVSTGINALYHHSFGGNVDFPPSVNIVPSYTTVMVRFLFVVPGS